MKPKLYHCPLCQRGPFSGPGLANHGCPTLPVIAFKGATSGMKFHHDQITTIRHDRLDFTTIRTIVEATDKRLNRKI